MKRRQPKNDIFDDYSPVYPCTRKAEIWAQNIDEWRISKGIVVLLRRQSRSLPSHRFSVDVTITHSSCSFSYLCCFFFFAEIGKINTLGFCLPSFKSTWNLLYSRQNHDVREILRNLIGCFEDWKLKETELSRKIKTLDWCIGTFKIIFTVKIRCFLSVKKIKECSNWVLADSRTVKKKWFVDCVVLIIRTAFYPFT